MGKNLKANQTNVTLETLLKVVPVGHEIIAHLWLIDTAAIGKLVSASKGCSEAVEIHVVSHHSEKENANSKLTLS